MKIFMTALKVSIFLFFAGWLLLLVTGKSLPSPSGGRKPANSHFSSSPRIAPVVPPAPQPKPSPIEMLRDID
jgi:hypothetical protein